MSEYNFSDDSDKEYARPRVSRITHELMKSEFCAHTSMMVKDGYDTVLQTVLRDTDMMVKIIEENSKEPKELTYTHNERLDEIVTLADEFGRFPTMGEVNRAPDTLSYLMYIKIFGSRERLFNAIKSEYPSVWDSIDKQNIVDTKT